VCHDSLMYSPPRLALAYLKSAVEAGAGAANDMEATDFLRQGERVCGIRARDALTGDVLDIAARSFSTPWAVGGAAAAAAPRSPARASAFLLKGCEFRRRTSVD
jgi:hypothetical protein